MNLEKLSALLARVPSPILAKLYLSDALVTWQRHVFLAGVYVSRLARPLEFEPRRLFVGQAQLPTDIRIFRSQFSNWLAVRVKPKYAKARPLTLDAAMLVAEGKVPVWPTVEGLW